MLKVSGRSRGVPLGCIGLLVVFALGCSGQREASGPAPVPLHLEELLGAAVVEGAALPDAPAQEASWGVGRGLERWQSLPSFVAGGRPAEVVVGEEALEVRLGEASRSPNPQDGRLHGGIFLEVPEWDLDRWSHVLIEARTSDPVTYLDVGYSVRTEPGSESDDQWPLVHFADGALVISDGRAHTYRLNAAPEERPSRPVREIGVEFGAATESTLELLSVTWVPKGSLYGESGTGVRSVKAGQGEAFGNVRRALFAHAPARISYSMTIPTGGRLDAGLSAVGAETRFEVQLDSDGRTTTLLDEKVPTGGEWRQRSVDLSRWAGREVVLSLEASSEGGPAIALWAAPTVSGGGVASRPNVILYVIDGASAGQMSLYGYERPTTPHLERIAAEGVVFERAHSNSTWTKPSTASFMTSLHHSVLGGHRDDHQEVPAAAVTMAEHFHRAGYQTAVFTTNPNAGSLSGLERGVDVFRDRYMEDHSASSVLLHEQFWRWREAYPGAPFWVHFQSTDVHPPHHPPALAAGRFLSAEKREEFDGWMQRVEMPWNHDSASVHEHYREELQAGGIPAHEFYSAMRDLHDETLVHQDEQIGRLVEGLKRAGEWERTLLIIASDHGHPAASYPRFGRGLLDPQPPPWEGALLGEFNSHIPLVFVWPGGIEGGRRVVEPVSMIDLLPTVLDLAGLPLPAVAQGRSLAPAIRGEEGWEPGPVVFDEFRVGADGRMLGNLELLDGDWGASLEIDLGASPTASGRHPAPAGGRWNSHEFTDVPRLMLYDVRIDPLAIANVTEQHPDRVARSRRELLALWDAHRALASRFQPGGGSALTAEQLESLRALGYIQ